MAVKMSVAVRNAILDGVESAIGVSAVLKLRTGAPPAQIADADSGSVLRTMSLAADWMNAAAAGVKTKLGTWSDNTAAAGTAAHFRVYATDGTTQHIQGTVSITGGGGDMTLDNDVLTSGQVVTLNTFTLTGPHA
jgi:hypothetical protein